LGEKRDDSKVAINCIKVWKKGEINASLFTGGGLNDAFTGGRENASWGLTQSLKKKVRKEAVAQPYVEK